MTTRLDKLREAASKECPDDWVYIVKAGELKDLCALVEAVVTRRNVIIKHGGELGMDEDEYTYAEWDRIQANVEDETSKWTETVE